MSRGLDVLVTLSLAASYASNNGANGTHDALVEARAAVAELVEAAKVVADAPNMAIILQNHPSMGTFPGPLTRLRAALAKFGGAA